MTELAPYSTLSQVLFEKKADPLANKKSFLDKLQVASQIAQTVHFLH